MNRFAVDRDHRIFESGADDVDGLRVAGRQDVPRQAEELKLRALQHPDPVVDGVGDVNRSKWINHQARRLKEAGLGGGDAVPVVAALTVAGDCGDDAVRSDLSNAVITRASNVAAPVRAGCDAARRTQPRLSGRPAVAIKAVLPVSRKGGDDSRGINTAHYAAGGIGDVD